MDTTGRTNRWCLSHLKIMWLQRRCRGIVLMTAALSLVAMGGGISSA